MKNYRLVFKILLIGFFTACQTAETATFAERKKPGLRYKKVYEGNRVIYKNKISKTSEKLVVPAEMVDFAKSEEMVLPLPARSAKSWEYFKNQRVAFRSSENHFGKTRLGNVAPRTFSEDSASQSQDGKSSRIFASLSLAFGLLSLLILFLTAGAGIYVSLVLGILGFFFGIAGLLSDRLAVAILGTVFSLGAVLLFVLAFA